MKDVTSHQNEQYRKKLLAEVKQSTNLMITTSVDQSTPLTDQNEGVNQFCFHLESIIVHGLQGGLCRCFFRIYYPLSKLSFVP